MKAELERNFSPINSQKAFGLRIGGIQKANNTQRIGSPDIKGRSIKQTL